MKKKKKKSLLEKFWSKIDIAGVDDCWLWKGTRFHFGKVPNSGGGQMMYIGVLYTACRLAYETEHKIKLDPSQLVMHHCIGNPHCCNPKHLFLGTRKDIGKIRVEHNRSNPVIGVNNVQSTLNELQIKAIKILHLSKEFKQKEIAIMFDTDQAKISRIVRNISYPIINENGKKTEKIDLQVNMKRKITKAQILEAYDLYLGGMSVDDLGKKYGIYYNYLYTLFKRHGLKPKGTRQKKKLGSP